MHNYSLRYSDDGIGAAKRVEFEAFDAARALFIAHREPSRRAAELWCEDRKLCTIRRIGEESDFWEVGPAF
ncbi:MAG TPA: hypothetical protein VEB68_10940 [Croceibacterium sp.]|nr:hypothetical protein [Croceibacterium sp.]